METIDEYSKIKKIRPYIPMMRKDSQKAIERQAIEE